MNHSIIFSVCDNLRDRSAGSHRIASHLRSSGWDVEVVDFTTFFTLEQIYALLDSRVTSNTKFIGISVLFNRNKAISLVTTICEYVKKKWPHVVTISGAQAPTSDNLVIDYHVSGYGEYALDALLKYLFSNGQRPTFDLSSGNRHTKIINALHAYPAYPFASPITKYEGRDFIQPNEWGRVEMSRGCKFACKFCNYPVLGVKGDYTSDAASIKEQLLYNYDQFGIKDYAITDETFNDRTEKITKFANMVETLPWKPYFWAYIRADLLISRPKDREELLRMGVLSHFHGIETFHPEAAKVIGKGMHPDKVKAGLIEVSDYFIKHAGFSYRPLISMIAGLPYETKESLTETIQWVKKNWLKHGFQMNTLDLQHPDDPRGSELSRNFTKFGYRVMDPADQKLNYNLRKVSLGNTESPLWENDNMNVYDAEKFSLEFSALNTVGKYNLKRLSGDGPLASILCDDNGIPISTDEKLRLNYHTDGPYKENFINKFLPNYINSKLSL